ncbi:MAG: hypothetical protein AAFZ15_21785 [Bacteroidota bacterium]
MKKLIIFLSLLISIQIVAQEKNGIAVLVNYPENKEDVHFKKIYSSMVEHFNASASNNYLFYDWNVNSNDVTYNEIINAQKTDQPPAQLIFMAPSLTYSEKPKLELTVDTTGKTTAAYYVMNYKSKIHYKVVEFKSSKIMSVGVHETVYDGGPMDKNFIKVPDFKKYFPGDPAKMKNGNIKQYYDSEKKLYEKYKNKINNWIKEGTEQCVKQTKNIPSLFNGLLDNNTYKMVNLDPAAIDKKLTDFEINGGKENAITLNDRFFLYQKSDYNGKAIYKQIAWTRATEVGEKKSTLKVFPFEKKRAAEAIKENPDVFLVRNTNTINEMLNETGEKYIISIDKGCVLCNVVFEENLKKIEGIEIVERQHIPVLKYFMEKYKNEKFIDFNLDDLQGKQQGAQVILQPSAKGVKATDVKTGQLLETQSIRFSSDLSAMFLNVFNKKIEVLKITDQKKNKINEVMAYHPFGFIRGEKFLFYEIMEEKVAGQTLERMVEIGAGYVGKMASNKVAAIKINKGKKEVSAAMNGGKNIRIVSKSEKSK